MFVKKHENSKVRSFRVPELLDNFFKETFVKNEKALLTANDFILNLIYNSQEYKNYLNSKRENDNTPSLFDETSMK